MATCTLDKTAQPAAREKPALPAVTRPAAWPRWLTACALSLVAVGVLWRTVRYVLQFPVWGDEAFICLNFLDRGYLDLLQPLRYGQVAPVLFLWSELAAYRVLGGSELALRLLPCLAGIGSLVLFWRWARQSVGPLAGVLGLSILAVSYYPVRHCCEIKPYSFDLCLSLAVLAPAAAWLRRPERSRPLAVLVVLVPLVVAGSYPAVFVAGAVSLALLPAAWRCRTWRVRALFAAYNLLLVGTFLAVYAVVGRGQFVSTGGTANAYWEDWFPPAGPLALVKWLLAAHTGNMMAYPAGSRDGASSLTFLLVALGAWQCVRARRWELLTLCMAPFALTFVAAALHRYPYGGSARVAQHLAPAICLLAGTGAAAVIEHVAASARAMRWSMATVCLALAVLAAVGVVRDVRRPYKTAGDAAVRGIVRDLVEAAGPDDQIVVLDRIGETGPTFEWYLRRQGSRVAWDGHVDWARLGAARDLWFLHFTGQGGMDATLAASLSAHALFRPADEATHSLQLGWTDDTIEHCRVYHWARAGEAP
jgi:hypothetical protein